MKMRKAVTIGLLALTMLILSTGLASAQEEGESEEHVPLLLLLKLLRLQMGTY